jgi:hypothetical protein
MCGAPKSAAQCSQFKFYTWWQISDSGRSGGLKKKHSSLSNENKKFTHFFTGKKV